MLFHLIPFFLMILASSTCLADYSSICLKHNSYCIIQVISLFFIFYHLQSRVVICTVSFTHAGLPPSPPAASMNNGLSNVNGPSLHPLAADVGNYRERKGRHVIIIIILSSVCAFILCAGAALVLYFKLRNHIHLTEASLAPTKPTGSETFYQWIIINFLFRAFLCDIFKMQQNAA
jgi:phosphate starvation-inducible membrane PsiE